MPEELRRHADTRWLSFCAHLEGMTIEERVVELKKWTNKEQVRDYADMLQRWGHLDAVKTRGG